MVLAKRIGKYEVLEQIGRGGMGAVYLCRDCDLDRLAAVKVMLGLLSDQTFRLRFLREARAAAALRHPNIITIYEVGEYEGELFIALEYVGGETLASLIRRGILALDGKLHILEQICAGLHFAHRAGIVHRDIKPANVMVDAEGLVRILDFGIARTLGTSLTLNGAVMGSINYMAPEQLSGADVDHRADIFSVGAVAYELISGRAAFGGGVEDGVIHRVLTVDPPLVSSVAPGIDPDIDLIVRRALEKRPERRYPTLQEMEMDIRRARSLIPHAPPETIVNQLVAANAPNSATNLDNME